MTTIIADRRRMVMVADTQMTINGIKVKYIKIRQLPNGDLIGGAGASAMIRKFIDWYEAGSYEESKPTFEEPFEVILLSEDGIYSLDQDCVKLKIEDDFYAIGSGFQMALAAVRAGSCVEDAVKIACEFDVYSSLPLQRMQYQKIEIKPKKSKKKTKAA